MKTRFLKSLIIFVFFLNSNNNFVFGQENYYIKLIGIEIKYYTEVVNKDTLIYPKEIVFIVSIRNNDPDQMALLFGSQHCFSKLAKYGVFKVFNCENKEFELCQFRDRPFCIQYGDSLDLVLFISDDDLSKFPFFNSKKGYQDLFNMLNIIYVPIPKDYPEFVNATFFRSPEKIDIDNFYVHIDITYPNEDRSLNYFEFEINHKK